MVKTNLSAIIITMLILVQSIYAQNPYLKDTVLVLEDRLDTSGSDVLRLYFKDNYFHISFHELGDTLDVTFDMVEIRDDMEVLDNDVVFSSYEDSFLLRPTYYIADSGYVHSMPLRFVQKNDTIMLCTVIDGGKVCAPNFLTNKNWPINSYNLFSTSTFIFKFYYGRSEYQGIDTVEVNNQLIVAYVFAEYLSMDGNEYVSYYYLDKEHLYLIRYKVNVNLREFKDYCISGYRQN